MQSTRLGQTGLKVSRLGVGAMNFGTEVSELEAVAILDRATELGIYFVDTADVYPVPVSPELWGVSETIVGRWLRGRRNSIVLASKCGNRVGPQPDDAGSSRKHIIEACENSLRRLGTDYIDIYYLHLPDPETPIEGSLETLDQLVRQGKIRYVGLSNFSSQQLTQAIQAIDDCGLTMIAAIQERYNLAARQIDQDIVPLAQKHSTGIVGYNPLGGGVLAGFPSRTDAPISGRFTLKLYQDRYLRDDVFAMAETVASIAGEIQATPAQVGLAWILQRPHGIVPLVGALNPDHLTDSVKSLEIALPAAVIERLDRQSEKFIHP